MAWLGPDLVVCTALRAMLLRLGDGAYMPLFALPDDSPTALLVQPVPQAQLVLLLVVRFPPQQLSAPVTSSGGAAEAWSSPDMLQLGPSLLVVH